MIKIAGRASDSFVFPADQSTAYQYLSNIPRLFGLMPHISLVTTTSPTEMRARYTSIELKSYQFDVYCDMQVLLDPDEIMLKIEPVDRLPAIPTEAKMSSATARGYFGCEVTFFEMEIDETLVEYRLQMDAQVPRPMGLRVMPGRVIGRIAKSITNGRMEAISQSFATNVVADFLAARDEAT
jgi:carbon monoxide dehydrogenase subunit G